MVQRTVASKCGAQIDGVKAERRVASFKPSSSSSSSSSSQNPDGKNRAADLRKKTKKSRAIQVSDFESLASSPIRKNVSPLPGKPPTNICSNGLEIKQKQNLPSPIRTSYGSPNYMKSTSCFDARKEVSQVSSGNSRICSDGKKPRRRNLENSAHVSVSGLKPTKCLTKCSSLKLVRTLTKTASFKKSSRVALCAEMNSHRGTCSSTLKDSKFPAYLMLSPGATESEGTSAMKVCSYSYCSLNGHRHAPLPPLKCFLSARRRSLKTQKNLKVEPSGCAVKGVDDDAGGKVVDEEMVTEALLNDGGLDFFIEIYAENLVDGARLVNQDCVMKGDCAGVSSSTEDDEAGSSNEKDMKQVVNISDGFMDSGVLFHGDEYEDDAGLTDTEMEEWEEQQFLSMESDGLEELEDQSSVENGGLSEETCLPNEELVGSGDVVKDCEGVFFEVDKEFNEKAEDFEQQFYIGDSELNRHPNWQVEEASQVSESLSFDQLSYLEDAFDEMDATSEIEYLELILNSELLEEESLDADIDNQMENEKQLYDANRGEVVTEAENSSEDSSGKFLEALLSDGQCHDIFATGNMNSGTQQDETKTSTVLEMTGNEDRSDLKIEETSLNDNSVVSVDIVEGKDRADSSVKAAKPSRTAIGSNQELDLSGKNWELNIKCKRLEDDESDDPRNFNPREPNYLPLVPELEAEKVDLKHQLIDDRKNAEEWMLDYALQRSVTKLAPAKKKKVALLVEAFESVMPPSRYEIHLRNNVSGDFTPAKRIQACF